MNLNPIDLVILVGYLLAVVVLGARLGRGARSPVDYMLGGRDLPWWLILASIIATETSTVTFLSIPGFAFENNLTWLQIPIGMLIGRFAVIWLLMPGYFQGRIYTAYQVLSQRFGGATERTASALFLLTRTLADGLRLFLTAIVLQEMTGIPMHRAVVAIGASTIVYTFFGGMKAVLWTDLLQLTIYLSGAFIAFYVLLDKLPGGWGDLMAIGGEAGKLKVFDPALDFSQPYGLWAGLLGGAFLTLGTHGVDQMMVQRYLSARSERDAQRALGWSGPLVVAQFALFLLIGVGLFTFYQVFPPAEAFERSDRVFAHFILNEMPVGVLGLLLGAVFAAAMSTLSSSLNSCATAAVNDFWSPSEGRAAVPERRLRATRLLTVLFGLLQIAVGIGGRWLDSNVVSAVLGIAGFTIGIVLGVFFLGLFLRRAGQRAALCGLVVGFAVMTWVYFGTDLAWPWYALVGSGITFAAGAAASSVWPSTSEAA